MRSRKLALVALLISAVIVISTASAEAQTQKRLSSTPKAFQTFYAKFKKAVLSNDKNAVASMTSFPFEYGWDAGDEGTYTRKQFLAKFEDIFGGSHKLFSQSNPSFIVDGKSLSLNNNADASAYTFEKKGGTYYFVSIIVEP